MAAATSNLKRSLVAAGVLAAVTAIAIGVVLRRPNEKALAQAWVKMANASALASADVKLAAEANEIFRREAPKTPNNPKLQFGLAWSYELSGKRDAARALYEKVAVLSHDHDEPEIEFFARYFMGRMDLLGGKAESSIGELRRAAEIAKGVKSTATDGAVPTCIGTRAGEVQMTLARAYMQMNVPDKSIEAYSLAVKARPWDWKPVFERGSYHLRLGHAKEARDDLLAAKGLNPQLAVAVETMLAKK